MSRICPVHSPSKEVEATASQTKWSSVKRRVPGMWSPFADQDPAEISLGRFDLIGRKLDLSDGAGGIDWGAPQATDHWQKMLHSLEWLDALSAEQGAAILESYCKGIPKSRHDMAWEAWTVAFRIQSVLRWQAQHGATDEVARSVAHWANHLNVNLEWRLTGNHLLKEVLALSLVGRCLEGPQAERWRTRGDRILIQSLAHDVLPDGGHEELSPMYHSLVLFDLLDLLAVVSPGETLYGPLCDATQRMATFLRGTVAPDGEIANLCDGGFGLAPRPADLLDRAAELGCVATKPEPGFRIYPNFGVAVLESPDWWVIFDGGEAGLEHLPAHGHADTLTLEASYRGNRLFVDTGVSVYSDVATRDRERGTAAHNTVCVAGRNSSDVYLNFRMGERARIQRFSGGLKDSQPWAEGEHNGYRFLPGKPQHFRHINLTSSGEFQIEDRVVSSQPQPWEIRWHLSPLWRVEPPKSNEQVWKLIGPEGQVVEGLCESRLARVEPAVVNLSFGHPLPTSVIVCPVDPSVQTHKWTFRPGR